MKIKKLKSWIDFLLIFYSINCEFTRINCELGWGTSYTEWNSV